MNERKPKPQTLATQKYQKKAGYKAKSYKLKGDVADRFAIACEKVGTSQASKITELMEQFIKDVEEM